jgi:hypothetical protein
MTSNKNELAETFEQVEIAAVRGSGRFFNSFGLLGAKL